MLALVLLGVLATPPDVLLHSEPRPAAPIVARSIPRDARRPFDENKFVVAVFAIRGDWYHISIGKQKAWLRKTSEMDFYAYLDLLTRRALLLTNRWNGKIYAKLGRDLVASPLLVQALRNRRNIGAKLLMNRMYQGELWLQIQVPVPDTCANVPPKLRPTIGWIPAYDSDGEPYVWFSTAGC